MVEQSCNRVGVSIGLSWSPVGGKIQIIEATKLHSRNEKYGIILTGLAGQTLKESVMIAQNWIQSFVKNVNYFIFIIVKQITKIASLSDYNFIY